MREAVAVAHGDGRHPVASDLFGSYDAIYGALGAVFGFMTWLWITAIIVIVDAELNGEVER